jgi:hypothetical protein
MPANTQPKKKMSLKVKAQASAAKKPVKDVEESRKRVREEDEEDAKPAESDLGAEEVEQEDEFSDAALAAAESDSSASASESESEAEAEAEDSGSDDIPKPLKKAKVSKKEESEKFANAMNALLDTRLKAYDRKDPILARSKRELKKFEDDKLEQKAKRLLLAEKKKKLTANRVKDLLPTDETIARQVLQHERQLKKTAQRGVIKLFNAILMTQTSTEADMSNESGLGQTKKKELVNELSKEKFLSLVQNAK